MPEAKPSVGGHAPAQSLNVLVADDEPLIVRALTRLLEERGHRVQAVGDAHEALRLVGAERFDAVLVDANMPGNGLSVLAHLEATGFRGSMVLMTGALASDAEGVSHGVRRLQKPFRYRSVIPLVEECAAG